MAEVLGIIGAAVTATEIVGSLSTLILRCKGGKQQLQRHKEVFTGLQTICQQISSTDQLDTEAIRTCLKSILETIAQHNTTLSSNKSSLKVLTTSLFEGEALAAAATQLEHLKTNLLLAISTAPKPENTATESQLASHANAIDGLRKAGLLRDDHRNTTYFFDSYAGNNVDQVNGFETVADSEGFDGNLVFCDSGKEGKGTQRAWAPGGIFVGMNFLSGTPGKSFQHLGPSIRTKEDLEALTKRG